MADSLGVLVPVDRSSPPGEANPFWRLNDREGALIGLGLRLKLGSAGASSSSEAGNERARWVRRWPTIGDAGSMPVKASPSGLAADRDEGRSAVDGRTSLRGNGEVMHCGSTVGDDGFVSAMRQSSQQYGLRGSFCCQTSTRHCTHCRLGARQAPSNVHVHVHDESK